MKEGQDLQGAADRILRPVEEPEDRDPGADRPDRRPGRGLVHGPVLRAVLPDAAVLKVDGATANILIAVSLLIGTPFFIVFGSLSDKIGRKAHHHGRLPDRRADLLPAVQGADQAANPASPPPSLEEQVVVHRRSGRDCSFQFNPTGTAKFTSSCDIAKRFWLPELGELREPRSRRRHAEGHGGEKVIKSYTAKVSRPTPKEGDAEFKKGVGDQI